MSSIRRYGGDLTASCCRRVVHVGSRDDGVVAFDTQSEGWQCGRAWEGVASLAAVVRCALNLCIVRRYDAVVQEE